MKWIDIKKELPEPDTDVLLFTEYGIIEGARSPNYKDEVRWDTVVLPIHGCGCCAEYEDVFTHWAELPKEP